MSAESAFDAKFAAFANCCRHESLHTYTRSSISNGVIHNGRWMNVELLLNRLYIPVFRMNGNRQVCCVFACIIAFIVRTQSLFTRRLTNVYQTPYRISI